LREVARKVRLSESIDADTVAISKDHYFANAFVVDLPLEAVPDHVRQDVFEPGVEVGHTCGIGSCLWWVRSLGL
jgi:hypothetical protein